MNLQQALDKIFATDYVLTRSALMERNSYIRYVGEKRALKLCRFGFEGLQTDWSPSPEELLATDWAITTA